MFILMAADPAFNTFKNIASYNSGALAIFGGVASSSIGQAQASTVGDLPDPSTLRGAAGGNQTNALASLERGESMTASLLSNVVSQIGQLYSSEASTRSDIANRTIQIVVASFQIAYYSGQVSQLQSQLTQHPEVASLIQSYENLLAQAQNSREMNMESLSQNKSALAGIVSQLFEAMSQEGNLETKKAAYAGLIDQIIAVMGERPQNYPQGNGRQILEDSIKGNNNTTSTKATSDQARTTEASNNNGLAAIFQPMKNLFTKVMGSILGSSQTKTI